MAVETMFQNWSTEEKQHRHAERQRSLFFFRAYEDPHFVLHEAGVLERQVESSVAASLLIHRPAVDAAGPVSQREARRLSPLRQVQNLDPCWRGGGRANSVAGDCDPRSCLCTQASHHMDFTDTDVRVLVRLVSVTETHPACSVPEDEC